MKLTEEEADEFIGGFTMVVVVMIGKIMFMMEMIVMKLNEEEAEEFIGGFTLVFTVVVKLVVFMMIYEKLFVKHRAVIVAQDFTDTHRGAG